MVDWTAQQVEKKRKTLEWLAGLKVGDEVAVPFGSGYAQRFEIRKVVRLTATRLIVGECGNTFEVERKNGKIRGLTYKFVEIPTPEIREAIARIAALSRVVTFRRDDWGLLTTKDLSEIAKKVVSARVRAREAAEGKRPAEPVDPCRCPSCVDGAPEQCDRERKATP